MERRAAKFLEGTVLVHPVLGRGYVHHVQVNLEGHDRTWVVLWEHLGKVESFLAGSVAEGEWQVDEGEEEEKSGSE